MEYHAKDRRLYNGAPCSDLQKEWDNTTALEKQMKQLDSTTSCTYFPLEAKYLVFTNSNLLENLNLTGPPKELTGNMHTSKQRALIEAIHKLKGDSGTNGL